MLNVDVILEHVSIERLSNMPGSLFVMQDSVAYICESEPDNVIR